MADREHHQGFSCDTTTSKVNTQPGVENFADQAEMHGLSGEYPEFFGDLPAVRAMALAQTNARDGERKLEQSSNMAIRASGSMRTYRSRSPLCRLDITRPRSRSRSPVIPPKQKGQRETAYKHVIQNKQNKPAQSNQPKQKAVVSSGHGKEISAVVRFCMKCFHADGDPNGKGHPFVFCPRASAAAKELAAVLEAREVGTGVERGKDGKDVVHLCLHAGHTSKAAALKCLGDRLAKGYSSKDNHVSQARPLSADAMQLFDEPCVSCTMQGSYAEAITHSALDCYQPTLEAKHWMRARGELDAIYKSCGLPLFKSRMLHRAAAQSVAADLQQPQVQRPDQRVRPSPLQQAQSQTDGHIHPDRLHLHQHGVDMEYSPRDQIALEGCDPDESWEVGVVDNMLRLEMEVRPNTWLKVALAVQGHLRHQLMMDVLEGDPAEGVPFTIPLLEILDGSINAFRREDGVA